MSAGQTANEGLPPLEPPQNIQKSKKAIHPTQMEQNECALKGQLNSGREIRLYQPIEPGKQNKKRQKQPQERSQKVEFSAGKANSTIAAAATATTTTVVVGGKQTKKKSKRQRQVSELCE